MKNTVKELLSLRSYRHFAQGLDSLLQRGMGAEQRRHRAAAKQGLYDAQCRSRRRKGRRRDALIICSKLLQGADQAVGLAHHPCTGFVRGEFPLARKTELQQHCAERRQKNQQEPDDTCPATTFAVIALSTSEPWAPLRNPGDGTRKRRG